MRCEAPGNVAPSSHRTVQVDLQESFPLAKPTLNVGNRIAEQRYLGPMVCKAARAASVLVRPPLRFVFVHECRLMMHEEAENNSSLVWVISVIKKSLFG